MKFEVVSITDLEGYPLSLDVTFDDGWMTRVPFSSEQEMPAILRGLAAATERHLALTPTEKRAKLVEIYVEHGLEVPPDTSPVPTVTGGKVTALTPAGEAALLDLISIKG